MHVGSVIAVNLNHGMDYFGNSVNLASKLQAFADAHEVAVSENVYQHLTASSAISSLKMTSKEWKIEGHKGLPVYVFMCVTLSSPFVSKAS